MPRIEKTNSKIERQIVTGLIVSTQFLREIKTIHHHRDFLQGAMAQTVAGWCFDYFDKYKKAPLTDIKEIYSAKTRAGLDEDTAGLVESFLESINDEYERADKFNSQYVLEQATIYFKERALKILCEDVQVLLTEGKTVEAEKLAYDYRTVEQPIVAGADPLNDIEKIQAAFESNVEPIVKYPGELGKIMNNGLCRDCFVAFMGPEKRGKSWWLLDIGMRALKQRCNVAWFQAGDMTELQQFRRIHIYLAQRSDRESYCKNIKVPVLDCKKNQSNDCGKKHRTCRTGILLDEETDAYMELEESIKSGYIPCDYCRRKAPEDYEPAHWYKIIDEIEPLTWRQAYKTGQEFLKYAKGRRLRLATYSNRTLSPDSIRNVLDVWEENDGFVPDVIVIDYADILISSTYTREFRHQQNEIWQDLRAVSQERHCLLVTATQADAASYNATDLDLSNFSEDKRKYAHVTMLFGLNQTAQNKRDGIMRISTLIAREDEFDKSRQAACLQCLAMGRPFLGSYPYYSNSHK